MGGGKARGLMGAWGMAGGKGVMAPCQEKQVGGRKGGSRGKHKANTQGNSSLTLEPPLHTLLWAGCAGCRVEGSSNGWMQATLG
jgi:hypothetical protein